MMNEITDLIEHLERYPWQRLRAGHMREGGPPALVATRQRNREQTNEDCATDLLRELQKHCDRFSGYQRYQVLLLDAEQQLLGEYICDLQGQERRPGPLTTTTATATMMMPEDSEVARVALRLTTASFGHAESAFRMLGTGYQSMLGSMAAENMRLRDRNEALERRDEDRRELAAQMDQAKHKRDLELATFERDTKQRQQGINTLVQIAPYAIAALSGANALGDLVGTLSPEQYQALMAVVSEEQRDQIIDLLRKADRGDIAKQILAGYLPPSAAAAQPSKAAASSAAASSAAASPPSEPQPEAA